MSSKIRFRKATIEDKALLEYWDTKPHVIACDPNGSWNWDEDLVNNSPFVNQFIAMVADEPIGYLMIIDPANEPTHYWGNVEQNFRAIDIWIGEEENLGKGFGTEMMNLALEKCFADASVNAVLIDPLTSTKPLCTESAEVLCGTESPGSHSKMKSELSSSSLFL